MDSPARATRPPLLSVRHLQIVVALLLAMRLAFMLFVAPIGDEAYYWVWGQHPDLSYFDHPPLNAWLLGIMSQVFGWTIGGLRILGWLTTAGTIWIFWLWSRRFASPEREGWFWLATAAYLAMPIVAIFSGMMFPDHLLVFLSIAALYAFARFFETWDAGHERWRYLFIAALALGLAALAKYSAVFVAAAVVLHILLAPRRWPLLRRWQL
jgi:4-amino-4-deoxy-L-arabinose transferase-like glycosyltransferase